MNCFNFKHPDLANMAKVLGSEITARGTLVQIERGIFPQGKNSSLFSDVFFETGNWEIATDAYIKSFSDNRVIADPNFRPSITERDLSIMRHVKFLADVPAIAKDNALKVLVGLEYMNSLMYGRTQDSIRIVKDESGFKIQEDTFDGYKVSFNDAIKATTAKDLHYLTLPIFARQNPKDLARFIFKASGQFSVPASLTGLFSIVNKENPTEDETAFLKSLYKESIKATKEYLAKEKQDSYLGELNSSDSFLNELVEHPDRKIDQFNSISLHREYQALKFARIETDRNQFREELAKIGFNQLREGFRFTHNADELLWSNIGKEDVAELLGTLKQNRVLKTVWNSMEASSPAISPKMFIENLYQKWKSGKKISKELDQAFEKIQANFEKYLQKRIPGLIMNESTSLNDIRALLLAQNTDNGNSYAGYEKSVLKAEHDILDREYSDFDNYTPGNDVKDGNTTYLDGGITINRQDWPIFKKRTAIQRGLNYFQQFSDSIEQIRADKNVDKDIVYDLFQEYPGIKEVIDAYMPWITNPLQLDAENLDELKRNMLREHEILYIDRSIGIGTNLFNPKDYGIISAEEDIETLMNEKAKALAQLEQESVTGSLRYKTTSGSLLADYRRVGESMEVNLKVKPGVNYEEFKDALETFVAELGEHYQFTSVKVVLPEQMTAKVVAWALFDSETFTADETSVTVPVDPAGWNTFQRSLEIEEDRMHRGKPRSYRRWQIRSIANRLSKRFGVVVKFENRPDQPHAGRWDADGKTVYLNIPNLTRDTSFHEILHPIIDVLEKENPAMYNDMVEIARENGYMDGTTSEKESLIMMLGIAAEKHFKVGETRFQETINRFIDWLQNLLNDVFGQRIAIRNLDVSSVDNFLSQLFNSTTRIKTIPEDYNTYGESGFRMNAQSKNFTSYKVLELQQAALDYFNDKDEFPNGVTLSSMYDLMKLSAENAEDHLKNVLGYTDEQIDGMTFEEILHRKWHNDKNEGSIYGKVTTSLSDGRVVFKPGEIFDIETQEDFIRLMSSKFNKEITPSPKVEGGITETQAMANRWVQEQLRYRALLHTLSLIRGPYKNDSERFLSLTLDQLTALEKTLGEFKTEVAVPLLTATQERINAMQSLSDMQEEMAPDYYGIKNRTIYLYESKVTDKVDGELENALPFFSLKRFNRLFVMDRTIDDNNRIVQIFQSKVLEANVNSSQAIEGIKELIRNAEKKEDRINLYYHKGSGPVPAGKTESALIYGGYKKQYFISREVAETFFNAGSINQDEYEFIIALHDIYDRYHPRAIKGIRTKKPIAIPVPKAFATREVFMKRFGIFNGFKLYGLVRPGKFDKIVIDMPPEMAQFMDAKFFDTYAREGITYEALKIELNPEFNIPIETIIRILSGARKQADKFYKQKVDKQGNILGVVRRGHTDPGFGGGILDMYAGEDIYQAIESNMVSAVRSWNLSQLIPFTRYVLAKYPEGLSRVNNMNAYLKEFTDERIFGVYQDDLVDEHGILNGLLGFTAMGTLGFNITSQIFNFLIAVVQNVVFLPFAVTATIGRVGSLMLGQGPVEGMKELSRVVHIMKSLYIGTIVQDTRAGGASKFFENLNKFLFSPIEIVEVVNQFSLFYGLVEPEELDQYDEKGNLIKGNKGITGQRLREISYAVRMVHGDYGFNRPAWSYSAIGKIIGMFKLSWMQTAFMNVYRQRMTDSNGHVQVGMVQSALLGARVAYFNRLSVADKIKYFEENKNDHKNELIAVIERSGIVRDVNENITHIAKIEPKFIEQRDRDNWLRATRTISAILLMEITRVLGQSGMDNLVANGEDEEGKKKKKRKDKLTKAELRRYNRLKLLQSAAQRLEADLLVPFPFPSAAVFGNYFKEPPSVAYGLNVIKLAIDLSTGEEVARGTDAAAKGEKKWINDLMRVIPGGQIPYQAKKAYRFYTNAAVKESLERQKETLEKNKAERAAKAKTSVPGTQQKTSGNKSPFVR